MTNYRLIDLWKAQMAAIIAPRLFQYGKSLLKSENRFLFRNINSEILHKEY